MSIRFLLLILIIALTVAAQEEPNIEQMPNIPDKYLKAKDKAFENFDQMLEKARERIQEENIISQDILEKMQEENPALYRRMLMKTWAELEKLNYLQAKDQNLYETSKERVQLEIQTWKLAIKYRQTEDETEKESIKAELREKLDSLFDLRELEKKQRITRLEEELAELKEAVQIRQANKQDIVTNRLNDMIGQKDELEW